MTITERIFIELSQKNIGQKEFAQRINANEKTVSAWKKNNSLPPADKLTDISNCLGVSLDYLLTGKENTVVSPAAIPLSGEEQSLLDSFNRLSEKGKGQVIERIKVIEELENKLLK